MERLSQDEDFVERPRFYQFEHKGAIIAQLHSYGGLIDGLLISNNI
jgi:hypothetical protein